MPSECRQRPRSAYKTPFRIGRRGQHNPVHFISARFACGLEHGTLAAALRQELLAQEHCIGGSAAYGECHQALGGAHRYGEYWSVNQPFTIQIVRCLLLYSHSITKLSGQARDELEHCALSLAALSTRALGVAKREEHWAEEHCIGKQASIALRAFQVAGQPPQ